MKKLLSLMMLLCSMVFIGAAFPSAPVAPSEGFYVSDYAGLLSKSQRQELLDLSSRLFEATGVQLVVLTVPDLGGMEVDAYSDAVIRGWEIGGADGKNGALLLVANKEKLLDVKVGAELQYLLEPLGDGSGSHSDNSQAIMNLHNTMLRGVYARAGLSPDEETAAPTEQPAKASNRRFTPGMAILLVGVLLLMARFFQLNRKSRRRYQAGKARVDAYPRRIRNLVHHGDLEYEYQESKPYEIPIDDDDKD